MDGAAGHERAVELTGQIAAEEPAVAMSGLGPRVREVDVVRVDRVVGDAVCEDTLGGSGDDAHVLEPATCGGGSERLGRAARAFDREEVGRRRGRRPDEEHLTAAGPDLDLDPAVVAEDREP